MRSCVETLPEYLKSEPTCNNFKVCKYIEFAQRDEGKFADVTDALMGSKEAVVDYGASLEDLIEEGTPIDVANNMATDKTSKKFKFVEAMAAPVRMKYQIRDSLEQSIAAGLGEYGDEYLSNKKEIRERKAELKREREEAKHQAELDKIRTGESQKQQRTRNQSQYGSSYGGYGNSYGGGMYGNQRRGLFGKGTRCILWVWWKYWYETWRVWTSADINYTFFTDRYRGSCCLPYYAEGICSCRFDCLARRLHPDNTRNCEKKYARERMACAMPVRSFGFVCWGISII